VLIDETDLKGVFRGHFDIFSDCRGLFSKFFGAPEIMRLWGTRSIKQINFSETRLTGTIRGLHFQNPPYAEMKLIVCLNGQVYDVAADLRAPSDTFKRHVSVVLNPFDFILIPEGCAHGFQVLAPDSRLLYLHSADYVVSAESGVRFNDETLQIEWPLQAVNVSDKDLQLPTLGDSFTGMTLHV